ncbi:hypothetical protein NHX12_029292 [Muraenolepis orangiensis]|uniref:Uncharacterized protein n=1 Tax=Muraenolepis orangiensis TaxID=630683 RepID=A0A9Q0EAW8_9TELE|nr:hypothetical protein NHX12_029292 [Muraenolepis orangiensis]
MRRRNSYSSPFGGGDRGENGAPGLRDQSRQLLTPHEKKSGRGRKRESAALRRPPQQAVGGDSDPLESKTERRKEGREKATQRALLHPRRGRRDREKASTDPQASHA